MKVDVVVERWKEGRVDGMKGERRSDRGMRSLSCLEAGAGRRG